eukprot:331498_1
MVIHCINFGFDHRVLSKTLLLKNSCLVKLEIMNKNYKYISIFVLVCDFRMTVQNKQIKHEAHDEPQRMPSLISTTALSSLDAYKKRSYQDIIRDLIKGNIAIMKKKSFFLCPHR